MPTSNKWFCETFVPGKREKGKVKHSFFIDKLVYRGRTPFQKVLIFDNPLYGRMLCLDGIVQFSQKDEFIYHETMVHSLLFSHPLPKDILIIGGGDGGCLREALRHPVRKIDLVDIDKKIISLAKKHLGFVCQDSFSDKRVNVYNQPGGRFIRKAENNSYDIVIVDSTNFSRGGTSSSLYSLNFYRKVFDILRKKGMIITLGASFLDFNIIKTIFRRLKGVFPYVSIVRFTMPSYNCGEYAFLSASKEIDPEEVKKKTLEMRFDKFKEKKALRYWSPAIHKAGFVLPKIWKIR